MCGSVASAPGIGPLRDAVEAVARPSASRSRRRPARRRSAHVAGGQAHARRRPRRCRSRSISRRRQSTTRPHSPRPGSCGTQRMQPPISSARVDEVHALEAALAEHDRALQPRRAGADHEHVAVGVGGALEALGMPAAAVLLARRRVLRAAEVAAAVRARVADVAADALADLVVAALARSCAAGTGRRSTGRAAPMRSQTPLSMTSAITSGSISGRRRRSAWRSPRGSAPVHSSW